MALGGVRVRVLDVDRLEEEAAVFGGDIEGGAFLDVEEVQNGLVQGDPLAVADLDELFDNGSVSLYRCYNRKLRLADRRKLAMPEQALGQLKPKKTDLGLGRGAVP